MKSAEWLIFMELHFSILGSKAVNFSYPFLSSVTQLMLRAMQGCVHTFSNVGRDITSVRFNKTSPLIDQLLSVICLLLLPSNYETINRPSPCSDRKHSHNNAVSLVACLLYFAACKLHLKSTFISIN